MPEDSAPSQLEQIPEASIHTLPATALKVPIADVSPEVSANGFRDADVIRKMIVDENNFINNRITWLSAFQGLLFAALGFFWGKPSAHPGIVASMFGIIGIVIAAFAFGSLHGATQAMRELYEWHEKQYPSYDGPPLIGLKPPITAEALSSNAGWIEKSKRLIKRAPFYITVWNALPVVLIMAWFAVLYINHASLVVRVFGPLVHIVKSI